MNWKNILTLIVITASQGLYGQNKTYKKPKNVIIMIGDGMGLAQLCAGYAYNQDFLNIFKYAKVVGLSKQAAMTIL
jgi:alkaline phosphatase